MALFSLDAPKTTTRKMVINSYTQEYSDLDKIKCEAHI